MYVTFEGSVEASLDQAAQFAQIGSLVDLSLNFHDQDGDVDRWCSFVEQVVRRHGHEVGSIGVTNEANLLDVPFAPDGAYPNALEALVDGVLIACSDEAQHGATRRAGSRGERYARPMPRPSGGGSCSVRRQGVRVRARFRGPRRCIPGGFDAHVPTTAELVRRTTEMLAGYRAQLSAAGIPDTVSRSACRECGWPTGPGRSEQDQAEVLRAIVDTVAGLRGRLGVTHWELFTLRDADSSRDDVFCQFGILRDDYTPKAAYDVLRTLINASA